MVAIGVCNSKFPESLGGLFRLAETFSATHVFAVGAKYKLRRTGASAGYRTQLAQFGSLVELRSNFPRMPLIGVERDARAASLVDFTHPADAVYLLGSDDDGLSREERNFCGSLVQVPFGTEPLTVVTAGAIVLWDRAFKAAKSSG